MRAFVSGCAGFIGSHLTESLLEDGYSVIGVDCFNDNYGRRQKLSNLARSRGWSGFEFVPLDLARGDLTDLVEECDVVFHLAAEPGVRPSWGQRFDTYLRNNLLASQKLLDAVKIAAANARFVYASSSSIYGQAESFPTSEDTLPQPMSPYGMTKLAAEHMTFLYHANFGVQATTLRYFSVYGPRQRPDMAFRIFCEAALRDEEFTVFGDGTQTRDFTYVADVVNATRAAAAVPGAIGNIYNIGGGSQVSLNDTIAVLSELVGRPLRVTYSGTVDGDVKDTSADITRAASDLVYRPTTDYKTGLESELAWVARSMSTPADQIARA